MTAPAHDLTGAVLCTGIPGPTLDHATRRALERMRPSGIILFRLNCEDVDQLRALTEQLHALPSAPLVSIDHEGGTVMRLRDPFTHFPPARTMSLTEDPQIAYAVGKAMATELTAVGIDLSYAPVLDVDSNPGNPIIGQRAFGPDPDTVIRFALPFMRGLQEGGVIPCGKHFPGHGDTDRDSHLELPVVRRLCEELLRTELAPFRAAIAAGIPAIMTAHVLYPALDPSVPATVSHTILQQVLRQKMGFTGVIVSDDLEMHALRAVGSVADCAVQSLQAGADWVLVCNDFEQSLLTADRLCEAARDGTLDGSALERSASRIRALRRRTASMAVSLPVRAHQELNERLRRHVSTAAEPRIG